MKAKLYIILAIVCILTSCNKSKTAQSIYNSTPATIYSMTPEEEAERMKDVNGCYGLSLDKTSIKQAKKIMKSEGASFEKRSRNSYDIYENGWKKITFECPEVKNIVEYESEIKHSYDKSTFIHMSFVNDTLSQICLSFRDKSYILENDLVQKYGEGNGEYKPTCFGRDKDGNINLKDCVLGYKYRQWQNETLYLDWHEDRATKEASNNFIKWNIVDLSDYDNRSIYTSKKMLPRIIYYFNKSYNLYKSKKEKEESSRIQKI